MANDLVLAKIDKARSYLVEAKTLQEVKEVIAVADAAKIYAKRVKAGIATKNEVEKFRAFAKAKLAEVYAAGPKAKGTRGRLGAGPGRGNKNGGVKIKPPFSDVPTLAELGINKKEITDGNILNSLGAAGLEKAFSAEPEKEINLNRLIKDIKEKNQRAARQAKRAAAAETAPALDSRIIIGDFRKHASKIADGSVSLIFTDPPYDREASKMLPDLAKFAEAKLAEGGSLICYVGQTQLPAALDALRKHLRYWWTIACVHAGRATVMREYGINAGWKAVLWFVKGTRDNNSIMVNDVMSGGEEKTHHDWQQAESEAAYWIEKLCPKDGLVCDPFLGSGTTAVAAKKLNRQWIGFELNETTAKNASTRIGGLKL